ncbi:hypothetical protein [Streptomyces sp. NPDC058382]|uniref:hypothetical protein n=1 Tax=unclassified Streptomyces TaxID=2593676 RepID=UPI0036377EA9
MRPARPRQTPASGTEGLPIPHLPRTRRRTALAAATTGLAVLAAGAPVAYATLDTGSSPEPRPATVAAVRGKDYIETRL